MSPTPGVTPLPAFLSLLLALALSIVPLPTVLAIAKPAWPLLVLIYWSMAFPGRVGILTAFVVGLLLDVLHQQLLGQHALGYALAIFIVLQIYPQLRVFPVWQQAVFVAFLVTLVQLIRLWVLGATGFPPGSWWFWSPVLTSALLWPLVYHLLRDLRRRWLLHLT